MCPTSLIHTNTNIPYDFHICDVTYLNAKLLFIMQMIGLYISRVPTVTQRWALMFGSPKYHQCCQVSNAGTDVCVCVCVGSGAITSTVSVHQQNQL